MKMIVFLHTLFLILSLGCSKISQEHAQEKSQEQVSNHLEFPSHWWASVREKEIPWWEILPAAGEKDKTVILSKRHELGILSNFAPTAFVLKGKKFASVEGLWQAATYPDPLMKNDPRLKCAFKLTRREVEQMASFEAKSAGDAGEACMKKLSINWVSFDGRKMIYQLQEKGPWYIIIRSAMLAKLEQNPPVMEALLSTQKLQLLPDHRTKPDDPPAWRYYEIWQEMRDEILK